MQERVVPDPQYSQPRVAFQWYEDRFKRDHEVKERFRVSVVIGSEVGFLKRVWPGAAEETGGRGEPSEEREPGLFGRERSRVCLPSDTQTERG